jgi:hypothetical protein
VPHAWDHSSADRRRNFAITKRRWLACATAIATLLFATTPVRAQAASDTAPPPSEREAACIAWLQRALEHRGFTLDWVERTAADGPSIVDAAPTPPNPSIVVAIAVRGETAHVIAPFLGYAQARRLVARAATNGELPFRCAIASEVAIASAEESRLRIPLLLTAFVAFATAATALRRPRRDQKAK